MIFLQAEMFVTTDRALWTQVLLKLFLENASSMNAETTIDGFVWHVRALVFWISPFQPAGKALAIKTDYAEAHNSLGTALQVQGKLDDAVASYHKALPR